MNKSRTFSIEEQVTTFTIEATDRGVVKVYSNDPVMMGRLEKVGATVYLECEDGGKFYDLPANQLSLRNPSKPMSEERKKELGKRLRRSRKGSELP